MDRMQSNNDGSGKGREKVCATCLYCHRDLEDPHEHCSRFARFVDHALSTASRDCDYWTPRPGLPRASA